LVGWLDEQQTVFPPELPLGGVQVSPAMHSLVVVHTPPVCVEPPQTPFVQVCPAPQAVLQLPQWALLVCVSKQAPLQFVEAGDPQQMLLAGPPVVPFGEQFELWHSGLDVQVWPFASVPWQKLNPLLLVQAWFVMHACPQEPQLLVVVRSVQVPLQLEVVPLVGQQMLPDAPPPTLPAQ
jgi:hypothetical protein